MDTTTELNHEGLREKAHELAYDGPTYAEIAVCLDVSKNSVAKAVTTTGPKFQRLQVRIVELLSDYKVEKREIFELHPMSEEEKEAELENKINELRDRLEKVQTESPEYPQ